MAIARKDMKIAEVRIFTVSGESGGGDHHRQTVGHWLIGTLIANPMSGHPLYKTSRTSWGIGVASYFGGPPACWLILERFKRFLIGADARNINLIRDQMFRASLFYGRKGLPIAAISVVDLALWDLVGKARGEPVYNLIGSLCREEISLYCIGPRADAIGQMGFWGA